jgi:hypothetical protein
MRPPVVPVATMSQPAKKSPWARDAKATMSSFFSSCAISAMRVRAADDRPPRSRD